MQDTLNQLIAQLTPLFGSYIPSLIGAMAILLVGWIAALILASMLRGALKRTRLDARLAGWIYLGEPNKADEVRLWTGNIAFYLIMIFVLIAVFQTLHLSQITEPLNLLLGQVFQFAPRLFSALLLLAIAWILATILRVGILRLLNTLRVDERLGSQAGISSGGRSPLASSIADAIYWLIFLLFLPAVLGALALEGLLTPVNSMMNTLLGFLPNLFAAGLILVTGWFLARIVQRIVTNLLAAVGTDRLSERVGLTQVLETRPLSNVVGVIVYVLILVPVLIAALNSLQLEAITQPASAMLGKILGAVPDIFGAVLVLALAFVVGRVVASLVSNLLTGLGFNGILARMGLAADNPAGTKSPSAIAGYLILVAIMLFASIEAARLLGFDLLATLVADFTVFGGQLILGLVIFGIGLYLANVAATAVQTAGGTQAALLARVTKIAILALGSAMALRQMGLANEIVNLAFGLILGALAVAFALALGLGGKEIAATELKTWVQNLRAKKS